MASAKSPLVNGPETEESPGTYCERNGYIKRHGLIKRFYPTTEDLDNGYASNHRNVYFEDGYAVELVRDKQGCWSRVHGWRTK